MFDWYLVWYVSLLVDGNVVDLSTVAEKQNDHALCVIEGKAKKEKFEIGLGKPYMTRGITGELVGFTVGCEERKRLKKWIYVPPVEIPPGMIPGRMGPSTNSKDP
ncbi:hypothetical protein LCGC14_1604370, partial [marine sediment metagenome]